MYGLLHDSIAPSTLLLLPCRLPGLFETIIRPPMSGPGLQIYITLYNTIWLFVAVCVAYGIASCLLGQTARLPYLAEAADQQVR